MGHPTLLVWVKREPIASRARLTGWGGVLVPLCIDGDREVASLAVDVGDGQGPEGDEIDSGDEFAEE
jgi:hypothetical protein